MKILGVIGTILTMFLAVLKTIGMASITWVAVFLPMLIVGGIWIVLLIVCAILAVAVAVLDK